MRPTCRGSGRRRCSPQHVDHADRSARTRAQCSGGVDGGRQQLLGLIDLDENGDDFAVPCKAANGLVGRVERLVGLWVQDGEIAFEARRLTAKSRGDCRECQKRDDRGEPEAGFACRGIGEKSKAGRAGRCVVGACVRQDQECGQERKGRDPRADESGGAELGKVREHLDLGRPERRESEDAGEAVGGDGQGHLTRGLAGALIGRKPLGAERIEVSDEVDAVINAQSCQQCGDRRGERRDGRAAERVHTEPDDEAHRRDDADEQRRHPAPVEEHKECVDQSDGKQCAQDRIGADGARCSRGDGVGSTEPDAHGTAGRGTQFVADRADQLDELGGLLQIVQRRVGSDTDEDGAAAATVAIVRELGGGRAGGCVGRGGVEGAVARQGGKFEESQWILEHTAAEHITRGAG